MILIFSVCESYFWNSVTAAKKQYVTQTATPKSPQWLLRPSPMIYWNDTTAHHSSQTWRLKRVSRLCITRASNAEHTVDRSVKVSSHCARQRVNARSENAPLYPVYTKKHTWSKHEANAFNIGYTCTTCALSLLHVCFLV